MWFWLLQGQARLFVLPRKATPSVVRPFYLCNASFDLVSETRYKGIWSYLMCSHIERCSVIRRTADKSTPSHTKLTIMTTGFSPYRLWNWRLNVNTLEHSPFGGTVNSSFHSQTVWRLHTEIQSTMTDQDSCLRVAASGTSPDITS